MFNKKHDPKEAEKLSPGYHNAIRDMEDQRPDFSDNLRKARPVVSR